MCRRQSRQKAKNNPYEQRIGLAVSKDESTLEKVPEAAIKALFGPKAVIANDRELKLRDIVTTKFDQLIIPLFGFQDFRMVQDLHRHSERF